MTLDEQRRNGRDCYELAVREIRRQLIREGRVRPTEDERREMEAERGNH